MKFSIIFKTVLFSTLTFIATTTYAANTNPTNSNEDIQLNEEDGGGAIIVITGRMAEVRDEQNRIAVNSNYTMTIKVMKEEKVLIEETINELQISLDLSELDAGVYTLVIETPNGVEKEEIKLD